MLKYKFNIKDINDKRLEIEYDELYLSPDGLFITGVTNPSYELSQHSTIYVQNILNDDIKEYPLYAENKTRCGYVKMEKTFNIEKENSNDDGFIHYIDGKKYAVETNYNGDRFIVINDIYHKVNSKNQINVILKYWCDDDVVSINGANYDIIESNTNIFPSNKIQDINEVYTYIILRDEVASEDEEYQRILYVFDRDKSKAQIVTHFKIQKDNDIYLNVTNIQHSLYNSNTTQWEENSNSNSNVVYVYLKNDKYDLKCGQTIQATRLHPIINGTNLIPYINCEYYDYNGEKYESVSDKMLYNNTLVNIDNNLYQKKKGVIYNGIIYENINKIPYNPSYKLLITESHNNLLRCTILDENFNDLIDNYTLYSYKLLNPLFDINNLEPLSSFNRSYYETPIKLFCNKSSVILPLQLSNDNSLNLHQEYVVKDVFFNAKKDEVINNIVDMEKDIYYPCYTIEKRRGDKTEYFYQLCDEIQIDLHFRSRDMNTWNINESISTNIDNFGENPNTWNIFDYYKHPSDNKQYKTYFPKLVLNGDLSYYPPSDLLYFLKFTNEDVFYQKQKIGKSFLRLSFYDSTNPYSQNLLAMSTVFMSETDLYNKYIENTKYENNFIIVEKRYQTTYDSIVNVNNANQNVTYNTNTYDDNNIVKNIGVGTEYVENKNSKSVLFKEDKRLSCAFRIKNRYEAVDSSEGFYLYLFKDLFQIPNDNTEEFQKTIYLKIEFNHAGEGKTINFMNMWNNVTDNNDVSHKEMINWGENIDNALKGYSLNELNDHLYIEINLSYDVKNKRFAYHLPQWMNEHNIDKNIMKINLFEVKINE